MTTLLVAIGGTAVVLEVDAGKPWKALTYVALSVVGGLVAAAAGYVLGRRLPA